MEGRWSLSEEPVGSSEEVLSELFGSSDPIALCMSAALEIPCALKNGRTHWLVVIKKAFGL
jgi:hypothetical protein